MPTKVTIIDMRKVPSGTVDRVGRYDMIVTYQIDPLHTYIITIPAEDLADDKVAETKIMEAIKKDMAQRGKWEGKTLEITP